MLLSEHERVKAYVEEMTHHPSSHIQYFLCFVVRFAIVTNMVREYQKYNISIEITSDA
jgi:hypothetical protein